MTMRAIVQPTYGSPEVLRLEEVARPTLGDDDVLVRVHAAAVCRGDVHLVTGKPWPLRLAFGLLRPSRRIAGQDIAGRVEAVGARVTSLRVGDDVFGQVTAGFADYVCAPAARLAPKPRNLGFDEAAAVPDSGMTALQALRDGCRLEAGQHVLINGASGGVGTFAVQIAKALGATVTAVCSTRHVGMVASLGADHVVDYTREDFTARGERYDAILDLVGNRALGDLRAALAPTGIYVASAGSPDHWAGSLGFLLSVMIAGAFRRRTMKSFMAKPSRDDLLALRDLVEAGALRPVIERRFALEDTAAAVGHVAAGHAQGKTVIAIAA
jgi:NADPH:quinone reductase-like Zn-dependent oxidoreductase